MPDEYKLSNADNEIIGTAITERKRNFDTKKKEPDMFSRKAPDKPTEEEPKEEITEQVKVLDAEAEAAVQY